MCSMIAVFDSGLGGLGVLREMLDDFDGEVVVYAADRANAPYGTRTLTEVRGLTTRHTQKLIDLGATTVVLACNTASAAALNQLREAFPGTRFVGMEPALKPASLSTSTGTIAVVATAATFQGELFESLMDRYAEGLEVLTTAAPDWVRLVESGTVSGPDALERIRRHTEPLIAQGADTLVLGCTHFGFLIDSIREVVGGDVTIIDPAPAVARQARLVHPPETGSGSLSARVSGDLRQFVELSGKVAGITFPGGVLPL